MFFHIYFGTKQWMCSWFWLVKGTTAVLRTFSAEELDITWSWQSCLSPFVRKGNDDRSRWWPTCHCVNVGSKTHGHCKSFGTRTNKTNIWSLTRETSKNLIFMRTAWVDVRVEAGKYRWTCVMWWFIHLKTKKKEIALPVVDVALPSFFHVHLPRFFFSLARTQSFRYN